MDSSELAAVVEMRAGQAYTLGKSRKPVDRKRASLMVAAVQVACSIMGERVSDLEKESRVKRLFLDIATGHII